MGQRAVDMALALIQGADSGNGVVSDLVVQGRLIIRESSGATVLPEE
jgi:hypothetical protein